MNHVIIEKLNIPRFKGMTNMTVEFGDSTKIYGANETGKTTIMDAFTWLLFGKDSTGKSVFDIKTINPDGSTTPKIDVEVEATIHINGRIINLRKVYREKWVTRRGDSEEVLDGHETLCFWDKVPVQIGEYKRRISDIIDEEVFKLVTDPFYFARMDKKEKRSVLISMAGEITDETILKIKPELGPVVGLLKGKNIAEEEKRINAEIRDINKTLDEIPARIDETNRAITSGEKDWDAIRTKIEEANKSLALKEKGRNNITSIGEEIRQKQQEVMNKIADLDRDAFSKKRESEMKASEKNAAITSDRQRAQRIIDGAMNEIEDCDIRIQRKQEDIQELEELNAKLRQDWTDENEKSLTINPEDIACPTCHREYDPDKVHEIQTEAIAKFNESKNKRLDQISKDGALNNTRIAQLKNEIETLKEKMQATEKDVADARELKAKYEKVKLHEPEIQKLDQVPGYLEAKSNLEDELRKIQDEYKPDTSEIDREIQELRNQIYQLKTELGGEDVVNKTKNRLQQIETQQKELSQRKAELERIELMVTEFRKTKIQEVENSVNQMFKYIRFRMFKAQMNGGEEEVCDAIYKGVPYESLNTAAKVNAGIDIINAICRHRNTTAPIFIDNRESVTDIIPTNSQVISLIVDPGATEIRITKI